MQAKRKVKRNYRDLEPAGSDASHWQIADDATVVIGGIYFEKVRYPLIVDGVSIVRLERNSATRKLAATFQIMGADGKQIAAVKQNEIIQYDQALYAGIASGDRSLLIETSSGRVICEIGIPAHDDGYELDIAFLTYPKPDYPIQAHPNRLKLGQPKPNGAPNFFGGTLTGERGAAVAAITLQNASYYLLNARIQNLAVGIQVITDDSAKGVNVGSLFWISK